MSGAGGITGNINITTTGQAEATKLLDVLKQYVPTLNALVPLLGELDVIESKQAASLNRTLTVYTKAAQLAGAWATATTKAAAAAEADASASDVLTEALNRTSAALTNVSGTTKRNYDAQTRTIALSKQLADLSLAEAKAIGVLAKAELDLAKAGTEAAKTQNLVNGTPLSVYQGMTLAQRALATETAKATQAANASEAAARKQEAAINKAAAAAEKEAEAQQKLAAATAAADQKRGGDQASAELNRITSSAQRAQTAIDQLAAAQNKLAAAEQAAAVKAAEQTAAEEAKNSTLHGSYFALFQMAAAYTLAAKAAETFLTAPVSAAAAYEESFNKVIITTDLFGSTAENAVGKAALLKSELEQSATTMPVSFQSLSNIAALGGQLGIASQDLAKFTETVGRYSAVTGISVDSATMAFGRLTNLLHLQAQEYPQLASALAELGNKSAATSDQIQNVATQISAAGVGAGLSKEDILGLSTAMASLQISPYLARGSVTRIFNDIDRAAADASGKGLQNFATVMGTTTEKAQQLQKTSPMAFFQDLIKGIHDTVQGGTALTTVLDGLGLKNASDIAVVERLSNNYGLLGNNVRLAYAAYAAKPPGKSYLEQVSEKLFSGVTAQAQELGNKLQNILGEAGAHALAPLSALIGLASKLLDIVAKIPAPVSLAVGAFAAMFAVYLTYKALLAGGIALTLAFKNSLGGLGVGAVRTSASFRTLLQAFRELRTGGESVVSGNAAIVGSNDTVIASNDSLIASNTRVATNAETSAAAEIAALEKVVAAKKEAAMVAAGLTAKPINQGWTGTTSPGLPTTQPVNHTMVPIGVGAGVPGAILTQADAAEAKLAAAQIVTAEAQVAAEATVLEGAQLRLNATYGTTSAELKAQVATMDAAALAATEDASAVNLLALRNAQLQVAATREEMASRGLTTEWNLGTAAALRLNSAQLVLARTELQTATAAEEEAIAIRDSTLASEQDTVAKEEESVAVGTLGVVSGETTVAVGLLGKAMKLLSGGSGIMILITGLSIAAGVLAQMFMKSGNAAETAAKQQEDLNASFLAGAGGQEAMQAALAKDTEAGTAAAGVHQELVRSYKDMNDGTAQLTTSWVTMDATGKVLATTVDHSRDAQVAFADSAISAANAAKGVAVEQDSMGRKVGLTTSELEQQNVVIGKNAQLLELAALKSQIVGDNAGKTGGEKGKNATGGDALLTQDDIAAARKAGVNFGDVYAQGITNGAKGAAAALEPINKVIQANLIAAQGKLAAAKAAMDAQITYSGVADRDSKLAVVAAQAQVDAAQQTKDRFSQLPGVFDSANTSMRQVVQAQTDITDGQHALGLAVDPVTGELTDQDTALSGLAESGLKASDVYKELDSRFSDLMSTAFQLSDSLGALQDATEKLGAGLVENGKSFSNYTEEGRANLANLETAFNAASAQQDNMVKTGQISAQQAATNMAKWVKDTVASLGAQGVDTSQLDFLVDYVNKVTQTPAVWTITTDTSGAIIGLSDLNNAAANTGNFINGVVQSVNVSIANAIAAMNALPAPTQSYAPSLDQEQQQYQHNAGSGGTNYTPAAPGLTLPSPTASTSPNNGAAALAAGQQKAQFAKDMADAKARDDAANAALQQQSQGQKAAGSAAKQAATDTVDAEQAKQDAIDLTNQRIQKQKDYIKDVGSFWASEGSAAAENAAGTGKVAEALSKLGTSIGENGTSFNQFSEGGRANLDALSGALDAYGATLQSQLTAGTITVDQAQKSFQQFAGQTRADLVAAGVPLKEINAYFQSMGASASFDKAGQGVHQFSGIVQDATKHVTDMGNAADAANKKAGLSAQELANYYKDVDDWFKKISENAFTAVNSQGAVFAALQNLGLSLEENGKSFTSMTDAGRKNFAALATVVSAFETDMQGRVDSGVITAKQGSKELADFSGGVYQELLRLGVKATEIKPIMASLGLNTTGFSTGDKAVKQYAGVLTAAEKAAVAAVKAQVELAKAADYAARLGDALTTAYNKYNELAAATDATVSAEQAMVQVHTDNIQKVKDLTKANADLKAGMDQDKSDIEGYNKQIALAQKYGQTDKAKDLIAKRDTVQADLNDKQDQTKKNTDEANEIKKYGNSLKGNSKEAIANRASVLSLQKTMFDQIEAYAKTGASQAKVTAYAKDLGKQFEATGRSAGYSSADLKKYTSQFAGYTTSVNAVPKNVSTTVTVKGDDAAARALAALGTSNTHTTNAVTAGTTAVKNTLNNLPKAAWYTTTARTAGTVAVTNTLNHIPKKADYTVTAKVSRRQALAALKNAGLSGGNYTVTPKATGLSALKNQVSTAIRDTAVTMQNVTAKILGVIGINVGSAGITTPKVIANQYVQPSTGNIIVPGYGHSYMGGQVGQVKGFAGGGQLPGTPPANPHADNLMAAGPRGVFAVRSKEWIIQEPAVEYYGNPMMSAINNMTFPKTGYAGGGSPGGGGGGDAPYVEARLSYADRKLLMQVVNRPVVAQIDGQRLDKVTANRQAAAVRSGAN